MEIGAAQFIYYGFLVFALCIASFAIVSIVHTQQEIRKIENAKSQQ